MMAEVVRLSAIRRIGGLDRVVVATAVLFAVLALADAGQAQASLLFTLDSMLSVAPFLIASVLVAAGAKATGVDRQVARVFSGSAATAILAAALFGALSPFCSCGVVPIIAALLKAGVPLGPVMAFWISSPLMDPEMFILMAAVLGLPFTLAKAGAAIFMGLFSGIATHLLVSGLSLRSPLRLDRGGCGSGCGGSALGKGDLVWRFWREDPRRRVFGAEVQATGWFLLKWLVLAFAVESLMVAYVPAEHVGAWLGGDGWWVIPASAIVGVPSYLNGYAAIPTVSALLEMGMLPGAALAFMLSGGVTSIPAAMAVFALVTRAVFAWYLLLGLSGSLIVGFAFQAFAGL